MTDSEMTKLCAEAMGMRVEQEYWASVGAHVWVLPDDWDENIQGHPRYNPLADDAQAMELVKKFRLAIGTDAQGWYLVFPDHPEDETCNADLNRAIVECLAKMKRGDAANSFPKGEK